MIINAPTGLYIPILPIGPGDPGNITFTISDNSPPRSGTTFIRLPPSEEYKSSPARVYTKLEKRRFYSSLLFNITVAGPSSTGSGNPQFEIGQVLDFVDASEEQADPYEMSEITLQQNTKVPDFEVAGISQDEYNRIVRASEERIEAITISIREVSTDLKNNSSAIKLNQSSINQSVALYDNTVIVLGGTDPIALKIKDNIEQLEREKTGLLEERDELQERLDLLRIELQKVREAVR